MTLVIPLIRTIWLSLLTGLPKELTWVGFQNYIDIVKDPGIIDFSDWTDLFTSRLFIVGMLALAAALIVALISGRQTGHRLGVNGGSITALAFGAILIGFAFFTVVRGTISNNLWWK